MERTCIVSRAPFAPEALIRFVASPQGEVVPDLKGSLPGRGAWVEGRRSVVEKAVAKAAFGRALKREVSVSKELPEQVESLLRRAAFDALSMARKAGLASAGFDKVEAGLRSGSAIAWISASDAGADGVRKLQNAAKSAQTGSELLRAFNSGEIGAIFGRDPVMHVALRDGGAARNALAKMRRWLAYHAG